MHRLRSECPWDKEQSLETLKSHLLEEAYECVDAMNEAVSDKSYEHLIEELGDVLLQVAFQAEILSEIKKSNAMEQIIETLNQKLIRRHPHVFGENKVNSAERALEQWDQIKRNERKQESTKNKLSFDSIAKSLTACQRAEKIGSRSNRVGFDWQNSSEVWNQFLSEIDELKSAKSFEEKKHEVGDILFSLIQWARHEKIDAEVSLHETNERFLKRFKSMLEIGNLSEEEFKKISLEEKEKLWKLAKIRES